MTAEEQPVEQMTLAEALVLMNRITREIEDVFTHGKRMKWPDYPKELVVVTTDGKGFAVRGEYGEYDAVWNCDFMTPSDWDREAFHKKYVQCKALGGSV